MEEVIQANMNYCKKFDLNITELDKPLPIMYWLPKMHKTSIGARFIIASKNCSTKPRLLKKGLKGMNLSSPGINSAVYISDSLCTYYKILWGKFSKLLLNKYIHSFWVTNGTIKLKTIENRQVFAVTHRNDLVDLFLDNDILADQV